MSGSRLVVPVVVLLHVCAIGASAATLHVSASGSDAGDCSRTSPCRTIAHAVSRTAARDTVTVYAGVYRERVWVTQSGKAGSPITIRAEGRVEMDGFRVDGDWVDIAGFHVDHGCLAGALSSATCRYRGTLSDPDVFGFWLAGSDITVRENYVTGTHWSGIASMGARNKILNNRLIRTGHPGMWIRASHNVVAGNEIADVMPYRYGPDDQRGQDQDAIRVFGTGHVLRKNYIHDIYFRREGPHPDAMQAFDNNGPKDSLIDVLIEGNTIINTMTGGMFECDAYALSRNVTWKNNVFINGESHMLQPEIPGFRFENNVFYTARYLGIGATFSGHVAGNTFLWTKGSYPIVPVITGEGNWIYPDPPLRKDAVRNERGGTVGIRPQMRNIPLAVVRTVADGTGSTLYLSPGDNLQLSIGSIIEIYSDGFARTVTAVDKTTGRVDFTPAISGAMARVPGSTFPADHGQWRIAASGRTVALWPTANVTPDFTRDAGPERRPDVRVVP